MIARERGLKGGKKSAASFSLVFLDYRRQNSPLFTLFILFDQEIVIHPFGRFSSNYRDRFSLATLASLTQLFSSRLITQEQE